MKRPLVFAMCLCMCFSLAGCSKSGESESSSSSAEESVSASADDELLKKIDEQQKLIEEQGKKLETVEKLFNSMFGASDSDGIFSENFDFDEKMKAFNSDVHAIYDDTAVVEAYKSGDSSSLTNEKDKFILEAASKAIKDIIKDGMSDYEKEKAVYDYVFSQSHYDEGNLAAIPHTEDNSHTPYGVLHDHVAICVGNATTFKLFMDMLGIECKVIHSTEQGEHAWDLVKIEDGWYHVDIMMDYGDKEAAYAYFNVPDSVKELGDYPWDHSDESDIKCTSTKLCYICNNAERLDDIYQLPQKLSEFTDSDNTAVYYCIDVPVGADAAVVQKQVQSVLSTMVSQYDEFIPLNAVADENRKRVCFGVSAFDVEEDDLDDFYDEDNEPENGIEIDFEKLEENFTEYLGELYDDYSFEYYDEYDE